MALTSISSIIERRELMSASQLDLVVLQGVSLAVVCCQVTERHVVQCVLR